MASGRILILDPAAGISGDMLLGALVDAGASPNWLLSLPDRLGFPEVTVEVERVSRCGIACTKVHVRLPGGAAEPASPDWTQSHQHPHAAAEQHSHGRAGGSEHAPPHSGHRHLGDLLAIIGAAKVSQWVRSKATEAFRLLCEAEGHVHGVSAESVALHEVGAVDALIDIVGAIEGVELLGVDCVYHRPVALGQGWIRAAHGVMAVPAPAVTRLIEGIDVGPNGPVTGESTTPTGAVLLRVLGAGPPPERWRPVATGWGAGSRNPVEYPNALRLMLAEPAREASQIVMVCSDLDDLSPEYVDPLRDALFSAGALDVHVWTTHTKKGRPGFRAEVICDTAAEAGIIEAFFLHSTTAGVRRSVMERVTLPRRQIEVPAPDGRPVKVKVLDTPSGPRVKAEFDDVRAAATRLGRPAIEIAREIETAARALVAGPAAVRSRSLKEQG